MVWLYIYCSDLLVVDLDDAFICFFKEDRGKHLNDLILMSITHRTMLSLCPPTQDWIAHLSVKTGLPAGWLKKKKRGKFQPLMELCQMLEWLFSRIQLNWRIGRYFFGFKGNLNKINQIIIYRRFSNHGGPLSVA